MLKVSVIIPCFNQGHFLSEAVDSVFRQTYANVEIVVVNDGSTDNTEEIVKQYGSRILYVKQANRGVSEARNNGMHHSSGDLIALLDADDRWLPSKLEMQVPLFDDRSVGLVHSAYRTFGSEGDSTEIWQPLRSSFDVHDFLEFNRIGLLTAIFPRAVIDNVGMFDTAFVLCEDWDLWIRIASRYRVVRCDKILAEYRLHDKNSTANLYEMLSARLSLLEKNRDIHKNCTACRVAFSRGRAEAFAELGASLRIQARIARQKGKYLKATEGFIRSVWPTLRGSKSLVARVQRRHTNERAFQMASKR